jgi:hypothetical protein
LPEYPPDRQSGDMVCPEADLNNQVATTTSMSNRGRMGWYLDGCAFSARTLQIRTFVRLAGELCTRPDGSGNDTSEVINLGALFLCRRRDQSCGLGLLGDLTGSVPKFTPTPKSGYPCGLWLLRAGARGFEPPTSRTRTVWPDLPNRGSHGWPSAVSVSTAVEASVRTAVDGFQSLDSNLLAWSKTPVQHR